MSAGTAVLRDKIADQLGLFNVRWDGPLEPVVLDAGERGPISEPRQGTYLKCARMSVDVEEDRIVATSPSGAWCEYSESRGAWHLGQVRVLPSSPRRCSTSKACPHSRQVYS